HFHTLTPEHVMEAADLLRMRLTGRIMALNSLENRVYDVDLAQTVDFGAGFSPANVILKFYRPGRWTREQIQEEHDFLLNLIEFEVPVVAPLEVDGKTLHRHPETNLFFALFPKVQGRLKDELVGDEIDQAGRLIGRIHNIGSMRDFSHRLALTPETFVAHARMTLRELRPVDFPSFDHYLQLLPQLQALLGPLIGNL